MFIITTYILHVHLYYYMYMLSVEKVKHSFTHKEENKDVWVPFPETIMNLRNTEKNKDKSWKYL